MSLTSATWCFQLQSKESNWRLSGFSKIQKSLTFQFLLLIFDCLCYNIGIFLNPREVCKTELNIEIFLSIALEFLAQIFCFSIICMHKITKLQIHFLQSYKEFQNQVNAKTHGCATAFLPTTMQDKNDQ